MTSRIPYTAVGGTHPQRRGSKKRVFLKQCGIKLQKPADIVTVTWGSLALPPTPHSVLEPVSFQDTEPPRVIKPEKAPEGVLSVLCRVTAQAREQTGVAAAVQSVEAMWWRQERACELSHEQHGESWLTGLE